MIRLLTAPFQLLWKLVSRLLSLTGRLLAGIVGLVCLVIGVLLSLTVIGAIIGVPLLVLGVLLIVRCLF
jgi:hypothetical protein